MNKQYAEYYQFPYIPNRSCEEFYLFFFFLENKKLILILKNNVRDTNYFINC